MSRQDRTTISPNQDAVITLKLALYDHRAELLSYVTRQLPPALRSSFDPADIVQDVYFEALRRATQFVEVDASSRSRWLLTIARNRVSYLMRRELASKRASQARNEDDPLVVLLEELAKYERTPSASAASREIHLELRRSVERLKPAHANAIRWRLFEGLTHGQIADRTGKTEVAVRQLFHYAIGALRKDLSATVSIP